MRETKELFDQYASDHLDTMPGLYDLLDRIEQKTTPKAVATSSPRAYMTPLLSRFALLERFVTTLTAEDVQHGKPNPEIYLTAAARLQVAPAEMLVLEDSETGTRAAASAGTVAISIPNKHTRQGDFSMASFLAESLHAEGVFSLVKRRQYASDYQKMPSNCAVDSCRNSQYQS